MCNFRIGHGYDVHRLVADRALILGGVTVPYEKGLLGHSDADVLLHAICPVYKCFKSDPHKTVAIGFVNEAKKVLALTSKNELVEVDVSERAQPFDKNMRGELNLKDKEVIVAVSNFEVNCVDSNTPTYQVETEHFTLEKKVKEEREEDEVVEEEKYEKVSILDLLGDDF